MTIWAEDEKITENAGNPSHRGLEFTLQYLK